LTPESVPGDDRKGFRVNGENGAQIFVGAGVFKFAGAVIGMILPVGLGHAHIQLAGGNGIEVVDRTAGAFHRAADAMLFASLVDQTGNGAAGGIVNAGHAAGADGHEGRLGLNRSRSGDNHQGQCKKQCCGKCE
jgi:hypothetical protein